jgi:hypothetical protein
MDMDLVLILLGVISAKGARALHNPSALIVITVALVELKRISNRNK